MNTPIHQNLKQLRLQRKLTQEQLAQRVHLTRQAISSYESGRTQPDLDTLQALADALEVDLLVLLYGHSNTDSLRLWRKRVAFVTVLLTLSGLFVGAAIRWAINAFLPISSSWEPPSNLLTMRFWGWMIYNLPISLALWAARLGSLSVLILTLPACPPVPVGKQLKWAALLGLGAFAVTLPWLLLDTSSWNYPINYLLYPTLVCISIVPLLTVSLLVTLVRRQLSSAQKKDEVIS